jgi:phosphatidate cytidylyltransferase
MTSPAAGTAGRWDDLRPRLISAAVMIAVGALEIWLGGAALVMLVVAITALMLWELAAMTAAGRKSAPQWIGLIGGLSLLAAVVPQSPLAAAFLLTPSLAMALTPRRHRQLSAVYAAAVMLSGYGLVMLREQAGTAAILWLVAVIVVTDVAGYFVGRIVGGPKFWPQISPKKTWSGTVAGWIGAALVGAGFVLYGHAGWALVILSAVISLAGQMGDIAESWIKRRTGVKDSSNLIPGHGGVLDRFDALTGAVVAVMLLGLILPLPLPVWGTP